jgi:hypothetical protein
MALFARRKNETAPPKAVLAAAMPLVGPEVRQVGNLRRAQTVEGWQTDAWYFFDAVGELRSPVTFIANACSQATPFAAEIDQDTQLVTGPTEDERVQRVAAMILGGASQRAQLLQTIAVCWQIPGELFVVVRPTPDRQGVVMPDTWLVLSGQKVTVKGGSWTYIDPMTMLPVSLGARDRLFRVWSPHPNDQAKADTAVRPALPILREIEKASMNIAAKLDSRLASNGIWLYPQEADFPAADGVPKATAIARYIMEAMEASLSNPGTAGAQAPILIEMPSEFIDVASKSHIDFTTALDGEVVELRNNALNRLAVTLDMPKDVAAGTQSEANHWSAWQVEESTYKIYIEPLLQRIADALTEHWFRPALRAMGITDVERYVIDWDTAAIVKRPDATEDQNWLWDNDLISDDARRIASGIPDDAIPSDDELEVRRLFELTKLDPTLLAVPEYAAMLGLPARPAATSAAPIVDTAVDAAPADTRALPAAQTEPDADTTGLTAAAELLVFDALSRVGGRLLTNQNRGQFTSTPRHELHTVIGSSVASDDALLEGSFQFVTQVADAFGLDAGDLEYVLRRHVIGLMNACKPHDRAVLTRDLRHVTRRP